MVTGPQFMNWVVSPLQLGLSCVSDICHIMPCMKVNAANKFINSQICKIGLKEITCLVWRDQGPQHGTSSSTDGNRRWTRIPSQHRLILLQSPEDTLIYFNKSLCVTSTDPILQISHKQASAAQRNFPNLHRKRCYSAQALLKCTWNGPSCLE